MNGPKLILFPGLGVDARIFAPQMGQPLDLELVDWAPPESPRESLKHYAARIASRLGARPDSFVGGVSLGAMVALEVAAAMQVRGVVVIGGCRSHREISPGFRALLKLGASMPIAAVRPAFSLAPPALTLFERLPRDHVRLMTRLFKENPPAQFRWGCGAILGWECCATPPRVPVYQIHGGNDEVIPPLPGDGRTLVPGGRHLINLSHPADVNAFILQSTCNGGVISQNGSAQARTPQCFE